MTGGWKIVPVPVSVKVPTYGPAATPETVYENVWLVPAAAMLHCTDAGPPVANRFSPLSVEGGAAATDGAGTAASTPSATDTRKTSRFMSLSSPRAKNRAGRPYRAPGLVSRRELERVMLGAW